MVAPPRSHSHTFSLGTILCFPLSNLNLKAPARSLVSAGPKLHVMRTILLSLFALAFLGAEAQAQQRGQGQWRNTYRDRPATLGGGLEIGIPVGAFADNWGREIIGLSANFAAPMRFLPFDVGFDFAWGRMGSQNDIVAVDQAFLAVTTGDLTVSSNVYGYHVLGRFKPINGKISPYIEGLVGLRQFTTKSVLRVEGAERPISKDRNANSFAGSAGWAVGVQVAPRNNFYVEGRVERMNTGKVSYVDPNSVVINTNGEVVFDTRSTPTRTVNVHLGIGFRF